MGAVINVESSCFNMMGSYADSIGSNGTRIMKITPEVSPQSERIQIRTVFHRCPECGFRGLYEGDCCNAACSRCVAGAH